MLGRKYDGEVCSIARSLEVVGERWSLLIIRNALFAGMTRFGDFQSHLGIATNVLTTRLEGFLEAGIMEKKQTTSGTEYLLTEKGRDLRTALVALTDWGDRWAAPNGAPIIYRHEECDGAVHSHLSCATCNQEPQTVIASRGPGMPADRGSRLP